MRNARDNTNKHQASPEQYSDSSKHVKSSQNELNVLNSLLIKKSYFTIEEPALLENTCYSRKICVVRYVKQNITIKVYCNYK